MDKIILSFANDTIILIILLRNSSSVCLLTRVIRKVRRLFATEFDRIGEICGPHENGLLYGSENPTIKARDAIKIKAAETKCMKKQWSTLGEIIKKYRDCNGTKYGPSFRQNTGHFTADN
jgi:hypothetical protein